MQKAREIYRQAIEGAQRGKFTESAAAMTARSAMAEARVGNATQARDLVRQALALDRSRGTLPFAGLALAIAGEATQAVAVAEELQKRFPLDTAVNNIQIPLIRGAIEISRGNAEKAIESLRPTVSYEFGLDARVVPNYLRGQAYLKLKQGKEAAAEFQKSLDHRGICGLSGFCALCRLQLGRARALAGDNAGARTAYQDFLAQWKDADPDVPILKEAKAEYAKLM
jgi:tetratricopeptide (TPR) repeat protein